MLTITKEFRFDAAHRLYLKDLTEEENRGIYGKCSDFHGHTYRLQVTVSGKVQATGMIINFTDLKQLVVDRIISRYDHACLNDLEEYRDLPTTAENMALHMFEELSARLEEKGITVTRVRLYETPDSWAEVTHNA
ncbi:MAG: 6-carboxytetrahydropterin synthase [Desulfobacteraceae bacterium]|nr:6-carboxytetrahydropterin synthase [Desulfobacteraceae bacterium]